MYPAEWATGPGLPLMRWTWIDRFTSFESGRAATAVKCLTLREVDLRLAGAKNLLGLFLGHHVVDQRTL